MVLAVCCAFLFGVLCGMRRLVAPQIEPGTQTTMPTPTEISTMEYQLVKAQLNARAARTVPELASLFARVMGFCPGGATKIPILDQDDHGAGIACPEHDFEPIELQSRPIDQVTWSKL